MARRRRRRRNPTRKQWIFIGLGTLAAAGAGAGIYYAVRRSRRSLFAADPYRRLPGPPEGTAVSPTSCGREYPGFVFQDGGCVPTSRTPAGIYVSEGCSDFVFVAGEEGDQPDFIGDMVVDAMQGSSGPTAPSANPIRMATNFFTEFWPECPWPPPPTASARIVHLFSAMTYLLGREVVDAGGRVFGTDSLDIVDELVFDQLAKMGYPDFDPEVVPELNIADNAPAPSPEPPVQPPEEDPTEFPQFQLPQGSEMWKHHKDGVGWHTIVVTPNKVQHPAVGQTVIVYDWWAWTPGEVLAKTNAFRSGSAGSMQEAVDAAKEEIDGYFLFQAETTQ
jgi:hypothetical protein